MKSELFCMSAEYCVVRRLNYVPGFWPQTAKRREEGGVPPTARERRIEWREAQGRKQ